MAFTWDDSLSVDVVSIDAQHRHLAESVHDLFTNAAQGAGEAVVLAGFDQLIDAVRGHFIHEERLMRAIGLSSLECHEQRHARLLQEVAIFRQRMQARLAAGELDEMRAYLEHWLVNHISLEDRQIRDHLNGEVEDEYQWPAPADSDKALVLIVDDAPSNIRVLAEILRDEHNVVFATSGEEALRLAHASPPDIILLDVVMPEMDGFTLCAKLKSSSMLKDVPVVFITSMDEVKNEARGLEVGAIDYITKPVSPSIVRARVRNHLELKSQRDRLRLIAQVDGLTGIANRRHFDQVLDKELRRSERNRSPLSLIMGDVDYFKRYNDHYGHLAGDECLREVASAFRDQMNRPGDQVARFGGEEFVCLLADTDEMGARQVAVRIQAALAARALPHVESEVAAVVTVSLGIATLPGGVVTERSKLLAQADLMLYEAKRKGRNRICAQIIGMT